MVVIKIDGKWRLEDLESFVEPIEIYDADDKFLGLFVPANMERGKQLYAEAIAQLAARGPLPPVTADTPTRLHSEVIAELRAKYPPHSRLNGAVTPVQESKACETPS